MEQMKLSTYPQAQGGGRLNRKNIVVSRPENPLNKGESPNFDTAKITPKTHINYGFLNVKNSCFQNKNNFINISLFSGKNNQNYNETNQNISHILDAKKDNFQTNNSRLENNHINITLFGSKCNQQTQNENDFEKKTNKTKLLALIFSLFFIFSTILTSGVFLIVNYVNKTNTNALSGDKALSIGNMLKDNNTIDFNTYQKLLTALGNNTTSIRNSASINSGNPIVFQMGTVTDSSGNVNPIYWQVVYQTADYITVWMTNSYTAEYYNRSGNSINNSALLGYTTGPYSDTGNYSQSVIRDLTKKIYDKVSTTFPVFADVVVTPSTVAKVNDWQSIQKNAYAFYWNSTSYWSITNGLGTNTYTGGGTSNKADINPYNWSYSSCMSDKFWIPSHYEVFNLDTATSVISTNGYWGLSSSTYIKDNSSTALDGSSTDQYCWLRSGSTIYSDNVMQVYFSGSAGFNSVVNSYGVRPAAHLSLSKLAEYAKYGIITTVNNDIMGTTSGNGVFSIDGTESATITAISNSGYAFNYWLEESTGNKIYSNPYTFTVTRHETYTAVFRSVAIFITTQNGGSEISSQTVDNLNTSNNYSLKFTANNYLTQMQFSGDSTPRTLKSSNGVFSDISSCTTLTYYTNTTGSELYLNILNWHGDEDLVITLYFTNTAQNYKATSGGGGVETVAVQSTIGGSAELVGDDYTNLTSGDTITVVARFKLNGYQFDGWYIDGELIATDMSARLTYDDIKGKVIVAQFSKIDSKTNTDTNTPDTGGFV